MASTINTNNSQDEARRRELNRQQQEEAARKALVEPEGARAAAQALVARYLQTESSGLNALPTASMTRSGADGSFQEPGGPTIVPAGPTVGGNFAPPNLIGPNAPPTDTDFIILEPAPSGDTSVPGFTTTPVYVDVSPQLAALNAPGASQDQQELNFQLIVGQWDHLDDATKSALVSFVDGVEDPVFRATLVGHVERAMTQPPVTSEAVGEVAAAQSAAVMDSLKGVYDPNVPSDQLPPEGQLYLTYALLDAYQKDPAANADLDVQAVVALQSELLSNSLLAAQLDTVRYEACHDPVTGAPIPPFPTNEEIEAWQQYLMSDDFAWRTQFQEFPDDFVRQNLEQFAYIVGPDDPRVMQVQENILQRTAMQLALDHVSDTSDVEELSTAMLTRLGWADGIVGVVAAAVDTAVQGFPAGGTFESFSESIRSAVAAAVGEDRTGQLGAAFATMSETGFFDGIASVLTGLSFGFQVTQVAASGAPPTPYELCELGAGFFSTMANGLNCADRVSKYYQANAGLWPRFTEAGGDLASYASSFFTALQDEIELVRLPEPAPVGTVEVVLEGGPLATSESAGPLARLWATRAPSLETAGRAAGVIGSVFNFGLRVSDMYRDVQDGAWGQLGADTIGAGLAVGSGVSLLADQLFAEETAAIVGGPAVGLAIGLGSLALFLVEEYAFGEDEVEKAAKPLRLWKKS